jgi:uncharacterized protein YodC (DUF2158 family)
MTFRVGDVVQLKSGGRRMTVVSITDEMATCVWDDAGSNPRHELPFAVLKSTDFGSTRVGTVSRATSWVNSRRR